MSPRVQVVLIALGCSAAVGAAGTLAVRSLRRPSMRTALLAVAVVGVGAVVAGVVGTAQAMFLSRHDLGVTMTVSLVAGAVGLLVAGVLSRAVIADARALRAAARALGTDPARRPDPRPRTAELADVADELAASGQRLLAARRREQALEASRRELVAWVSHDLRTPLAGLRAMAEALEDDLADDPRRYHRQMRREVERLSRMVDDLFELSRIQSGALALSLERLDLMDLVGDVLAGARPVAAARGVRLEASVGSVVLAADGPRLGRVLANLVVNAIRHTPDDGTVLVHAAMDGDDAVLAVTDRCGGIPRSDLARVFEPGWRGSPSRSTAAAGAPPTVGPDPDDAATAPLTPGAGLGLAIARGIVTAHRGRIEVRNTSGGCRFEIRLPTAGAR